MQFVFILFKRLNVKRLSLVTETVPVKRLNLRALVQSGPLGPPGGLCQRFFFLVSVPEA